MVRGCGEGPRLPTGTPRGVRIQPPVPGWLIHIQCCVPGSICALGRRAGAWTRPKKSGRGADKVKRWENADVGIRFGNLSRASRPSGGRGDVAHRCPFAVFASNVATRKERSGEGKGAPIPKSASSYNQNFESQIVSGIRAPSLALMRPRSRWDSRATSWRNVT